MLSVEQAAAVLHILGYPTTERNLREWSYKQKGALPSLDLLVGAERTKHDAAYAWHDDVMGQIFTFAWFMNDRARIGDAKLRTWWAGFSYPVEEMQRLWISWSDREVAQLQRDVAHAEFDAAAERDFVAGIPAMLRQDKPRLARGTPVHLFDTLAVLAVDPQFSADSLSGEELAALRRELKDVSTHDSDKETFAASLDLVTDDVTRHAIAFVHRYFSPASLSAVLRGAAPRDLEAAHADWLVLAGGYRWLLMRTIADKCRRIGGEHQLALTILPPLASRLGRAFILADLALRQAGRRSEVDQTFHLLREVVCHPGLRPMAEVVRQHTLDAQDGVFASYEDAREHQETALRELALRYPEVMALTDGTGAVLAAIGDIWRPLIESIHVWRPDVLPVEA